MNILAIDVGGTNVKILATEHEQPRKFAFGQILTALGGFRLWDEPDKPLTLAKISS